MTPVLSLVTDHLYYLALVLGITTTAVAWMEKRKHKNTFKRSSLVTYGLYFMILITGYQVMELAAYLFNGEWLFVQTAYRVFLDVSILIYLFYHVQQALLMHVNHHPTNEKELAQQIENTIKKSQEETKAYQLLAEFKNEESRN